MGKFILRVILLGGIGCTFIGSGCSLGPPDDDDDDDGGDDDTDDDGLPVRPLEVISTLPAADATDVDADLSVAVTFSSRVRSETISAETFVVTGPLGAVPGGYRVEEEVVTFIPAAPLHLLGHYDVSLTEAIIGYEEGPLAAPYEWGYGISEGDWTDRVDLATDVGDFVDLARNRRGDMVLAFTTLSPPASIKAVRYDSALRTFSLPELLEESATPFGGARAAINENGDIVVAWSAASDPATRGWARRSGGAWQDATIEAGAAGSLGLTTGGTAVMATTALADTVVETLDPGASAWSAPATAMVGASLVGVLQSAERAELIAYDETLQQLVSRAYVEGGGLDGQQSLSDAGVTAGAVFLQYLPGDDLAVSWAQADAQLWYSHFDGAENTWSPAMLASGVMGSALCANSAGARIAAFIDGDGSIFAVHADPEQDFSPAADLGSPAGMQYARCAIDDLGNGAVFWAEAGGKSFQSRYAGGFTQAAELGDGPTLFAAVAEPGTGRVRALFYNGEKLTTRAFE